MRHIPALDGLRGLAIVLVIIYHAKVEPSELGIDRVVFGLRGAGWMGVDLFFVLSGFLISGILLDAKGNANYFRHFYMRRILRIFRCTMLRSRCSFSWPHT